MLFKSAALYYVARPKIKIKLKILNFVNSKTVLEGKFQMAGKPTE